MVFFVHMLSKRKTVYGFSPLQLRIPQGVLHPLFIHIAWHLAIGRFSQNHTQVINYYAEEIERLMGGIDIYCGTSGLGYKWVWKPNYVTVSRGALYWRQPTWALLMENVDCFLPWLMKKYHIVHIVLALWLVVYYYSTDPIGPCCQCCQWDMEST